MTERNIFEFMEKEKVLSELVKIFGSPYVTDKPPDLYPYSYDSTESPSHMPNFIVLPEKVEEIVQLIKFCNEFKIPIIPYTSGNNVGALTVPEQGGIICDLGKRMKKIIKVHESMMYALIEPGVTWGQLNKYLDENHPNLKYGYTYAPPYASVLSNNLLSGLSNLSTAYGCMGDFLNGLEVVLYNGDVVRTGTAFLSRDFKDNNWFGRYPMPDLTSLFMCWQGMTGIVTKGAIQLMTKKEHNTALVALVYGGEECAELVRAFGRTECCEDVSAMNIEIVKMTLGLLNPPKFEREPDFGIILCIAANSLELLNAKVNYIKEVFEEVKKKSEKIMKLTNFGTFANLLGKKFAIYYDLPTVITPMVEYSGTTWVGCYGSTDYTGALFDECYKIYKDNHSEPLIFMKSMKSSHYCVFMAISRYKYKDLDKIIPMQHKFLDIMLEHNCIPYKTPVWMTEKIREQCDQNWIKLLERIKKKMDPNNIFNPGKWGLS